MQINQKLYAPDSLICPAHRIFDTDAAAAALKTAAAAGDQRQIRMATVDYLRQARSSGNQAIEHAFAQHPFAADLVRRSYAYLADCLVQSAFDVASTHLHPGANTTDDERLSILAVGGSGRAEMAPHSDIDLLFLTPDKLTPGTESIIEYMLYILWDLRLKLGHASRTIADCIRLGREDFTIRTALLEERYLCGDPALADDLKQTLTEQLFRGTAPEFIEAKLAERDLRHIKQGGQRYMVEPNVKEGKGGLRDLQSLFWIAKYVHQVDDVGELVGLGLFRQDEYDRFAKAENFLWASRCHLHLIAGRAQEQLTFDMQVEVAKRMGYKSHGGRRSVEHFMQDYFRHATHVGDLTRILLTALEAQHVKQQPRLKRPFRGRKKTRANYKIEQNRLNIADEAAFLQDKLNILRLFEEALRTEILIHPDAMRLVTQNLHLIDDEMRHDKEARRIFLDLLLKHGNPERALRRMNELGVLAAFIPEFAPIVAMMQFNMYHHYTVDEHTIQCISTLAQIERGELTEELPISSELIRTGVNRKVLYVALFLHDIGKGRDEDHSILGARIARKVAPRLGLKPAQCETVEWLVRNHLRMSDVAQKRDISDPATVRGFAKAVKTVERLELLTLLTICDIRGVGPETWNNWKAMLMRNLYNDTRQALENGLEDFNRTNRRIEAQKALRAALPDWSKKDLQTETRRHNSDYWQGLRGHAHVTFARLLKDLPEGGIAIDLTPSEDRDATRVCFVLSDYPGLFSRLAGALALVGANVVDANTYTSKDGYATAIFWIQDNNGAPYEGDRLERLHATLMRTLKGNTIADDVLQSRDKLKKRERAFRVPTAITFDNEGSELYTIIEVDTRDRPALLYDLTRTLANADVSIASAVIATYGEQVVDTFYVRDMQGQKLEDQDFQQALKQQLQQSITTGSLRARAQ
ncbi:MAG: [protein-PII] uridylyltransferase [Rhodobacterales bacterium]|nr:MAG: [protein-PII] uridylyltransferase [Rhodobacterales bacterium]